MYGACNVSCDGGIQNRTVTCVDQFAKAALDGACQGSKPASEADCGTAPCDFCSTTDCTSQVLSYNTFLLCNISGQRLVEGSTDTEMLANPVL